MRIITLLTQKGGAGKTTLAASLAIAAAEASARDKIVALDLDPQASLMAWGNRRKTAWPRNLSLDGVRADQLPRLRQFLTGLASKGFTTAILDTAGVDNPGTHIAIEAATLCLIPVQPSTIDLTATVPSFRAVARLHPREDAVAFIINRSPSLKRTKEAELALAALGLLAEPVIPARADHQDALGAGLGVTEYAPDGKAAGEIRDLWGWIAKHTKGGNARG